MNSWEDVLKGVVGNYAQAYTNNKYQQPYELQKLALQAYGPGPDGRQYYAGQPVQTGIPSGWLLVGGAVVLAVVLMKS